MVLILKKKLYLCNINVILISNMESKTEKLWKI